MYRESEDKISQELLSGHTFLVAKRACHDSYQHIKGSAGLQ